MSSFDAGLPPTYNYTGLPNPDELSQTALDDCGPVSVLGAASLRPSELRAQITERRDTGEHTILLNQLVMGANGQALRRPIGVVVTQKDIADNIARRGASAVDEGVPNAPSWPAVAEAGAAKLLDSNPADGLDEGYAKLDHMTQPTALMLFTGRLVDSKRSVIPGMLERPPGAHPEEKVYQNARQAIKEGREVLISTADQGTGGVCVGVKPSASKASLTTLDGLQDRHGYFVVAARRGDHGEPMFVVHNTAPHNVDGEAPDTMAPTMQVPVRTLLEAGDAIIVAGDKLPEEPRQPPTKLRSDEL